LPIYKKNNHGRIVNYSEMGKETIYVIQLDLFVYLNHGVYIHLGETRYYITADVHARVFTSAIIQYYKMQWPTTVLVFPPFPTLL
jgi:hypothetical protein